MTWQLWRQDDHGNEFLVATFAERAAADAECARFAALPHHQHYWVAGARSDLDEEGRQIYHRIGRPGGPAAEVEVQDVQIRVGGGQHEAAQLLSAERDAEEVELLRTICEKLGVAWGNDDFGWWATVPRELSSVAWRRRQDRLDAGCQDHPDDADPAA